MACSGSRLGNRFLPKNLQLNSYRRLYKGYTKLTPSLKRNVTTFSTTHDYIICGTGSAGCVLANRLTADSSNNVLLLEAGPRDWTWKIHMPAALVYNLCNDKYNWYYHTVPQKHMNDRVMYCPRGRVWGGSSSLNAMVYIRGHALDYDRWESEGAKGWSYADCLPYFKKAQTHELGEDDYRGGDGPLHVSRGKTRNALFNAFLEASKQAGYPFTDDMNGYQQEGVGWMDMTIHKGVRWNTANAYLRPALKRRHNQLMAKTKAFITRILFEGNKTVGVEYLQDFQVRRAKANKEVILSGGAINSPQILMLSGIGDLNELLKLGIRPVSHLPGVGQNLQDHLEMWLIQACKKPITLYSAQKLWNMVPIGIRWFLFQTGLGATAHLEAGGFIRSREGVPHPNIQFHFLPSGVIDHGRTPISQHAYQVHVGSMRSQSKGYIKLKSANPKEHPIIDFNYMSTKEDWEELRACVRLSREIFQQKAFDEFRGEELKPGKDAQTDEEIDAFIRQYADTAYHPSCTCKMGDAADKSAVVDNQGRVFGVENLRVVDSSIMPSIVSGNLNAPTIMIAEKISDCILGNQPLPRSNAPVFQTPEKGQR